MTTLSTSSVPDCRSALTLPNFGWSSARVHGRPLAMNVIEVSVMTAGIMVCSGLGLGSFFEFFVVEVFFLDLQHFRPGEKRQVVAHLRDRLPVLVRVITRAIEDHLEKRVLDAQFLVSLIDRGDRASFSSGLVDSPMLFVLPIYGDGPVRTGDKLGLEKLDGLADCWHVRTRAALGAQTGYVGEVASRVQLAVEPTHREAVLIGALADGISERLSQDGERLIVTIEKRDAEFLGSLGDLMRRAVWQDAVNADRAARTGRQFQLFILASGPGDQAIDAELASLRPDGMYGTSRQQLQKIDRLA